MLNDYLRPIATAVGITLLTFNAGCASKPEDSMSLAQKQSYISTFIQNYLKINGNKVALLIPDQPMRLSVVLQQHDLDELNTLSDEERLRRYDVKEPFVKDGFIEFADIAIGKDPKDETPYFVVRYIPEQARGTWFRDIGESGFKFGTRSLSDKVSSRYSNEEVSEMILGEGDHEPLVRDLTYNFNWINLTKSNPPGVDRFVRSLTVKDQIEQNARFEKALDHIIATLVKRYGNKYNLVFLQDWLDCFGLRLDSLKLEK